MALDPDLLKVLAADSRRDILRLLAQRRMTLTELAASLDLKKATVLEHLKRLTDADLIRRKEDDRLWVYYELTSRGSRVVSPGRTRFYLLFGLSLAALGAAALLVLALSSPHVPEPGVPMDARGQPLAVALDGGALEPGEAFRMYAESVGEPRAYLLDAEAAARLRSGETFVQGIPLGEPAPWSNDAGAPAAGTAPTGVTRPPPTTATYDATSKPTPQTLALATPAGLAPGTYYVYVVDALGRTNAKDLAVLVVEGPRVEVTPAVAWLGLTERVDFRADDAASDGTLQLVRENAVVANLTLEAGTSVLEAAQLDALEPGIYRLREAGRTLAATLEVRDPQPSLLTPVLVDGSPLRVATAPGAVPEVPIVVDGEPLGAATLALGVHEVRLGRLVSATVEVVEGLALGGGSSGNVTTFTLTNATGAPVPDARVAVDDLLVGETDTDGRIALHRLDDGPHVVRLDLGDDTRIVPVEVTEGEVRASTLAVSFEATPLEESLHAEARLAAAPPGARVAFYAFVDGVPRAAVVREANGSGGASASFALAGIEAGQRSLSVEAFLAEGVSVGGAPPLPPASAGTIGRSVQVAAATPDTFDTTNPGRVVVPPPGATSPTAGVGEPAAVPAPAPLAVAAALLLAALVAAARKRRE